VLDEFTKVNTQCTTDPTKRDDASLSSTISEASVDACLTKCKDDETCFSAEWIVVSSETDMTTTCRLWKEDGLDGEQEVDEDVTEGGLFANAPEP